MQIAMWPEPDLRIKPYAHDRWHLTTASPRVKYYYGRGRLVEFAGARDVAVDAQFWTREDCDSFFAALPAVRWRTLHFSHIRNESFFLPIVAYIATSHPTIRRLRFTDSGAGPLRQLLAESNTQVDEVYIDEADVPRGEDAARGRSRALRRIFLYNVSVERAQMDALAALAGDSVLEALHVWPSRARMGGRNYAVFDDRGIGGLCDALAAPACALRDLCLKASCADEVAVRFARAVAGSAVERLDFARSTLPGGFVDELVWSRALRHLHLQFHPGAAEAVALAARLVREMPRLEKLVFRTPGPANTYDGVDGGALAHALAENTRLRSLGFLLHSGPDGAAPSPAAEDPPVLQVRPEIAQALARNAALIHSPFMADNVRNERIAVLNTTCAARYVAGVRVVIVGPARADAAARFPRDFAVPEEHPVAQAEHLTEVMGYAAVAHVAERERPAPPVDRRLLIGMETANPRRAPPPRGWFFPVVADTPDMAAALAAPRTFYLVALGRRADPAEMGRLAEMYGSRLHAVAFSPASAETRHADRAAVLAAFPRAAWVGDLAALSPANFGLSEPRDAPFRQLLFAREVLRRDAALVLLPADVREIAAAAGLATLGEVYEAGNLAAQCAWLADGSLVTDVARLLDKLRAVFLAGAPWTRLIHAVRDAPGAAGAAKLLRRHRLDGATAVGAFRHACGAAVAPGAAVDFLVRAGLIVFVPPADFVLSMPQFPEGTPYLYARLLRTPAAELVDARADGRIHFQFARHQFAAHVAADGRWCLSADAAVPNDARARLSEVLPLAWEN